MVETFNLGEKMKRTIITVLATLAVVALVALAVGPKAQRVATTTAVAAPEPAPVPKPPRCPNIYQAIGGLRTAQQEFERRWPRFLWS
jgi:hypothetical protein